MELVLGDVSGVCAGLHGGTAAPWSAVSGLSSIRNGARHSSQPTCIMPCCELEDSCPTAISTRTIEGCGAECPCSGAGFRVRSGWLSMLSLSVRRAFRTAMVTASK